MSEPERLSITPPTVYRVPKKCTGCRKQWEGNSFRPAPTDGSRVAGLCDDCITREEAAKRAAAKPEGDDGKEVQVVPPRKVFGYDD